MKEQANTSSTPIDPSSTIVPHSHRETPTNNDHLCWPLDVRPWPEPVKGKLLLNQLASVFGRFIDLPPGGPEALALWTLHTYAYHLRDRTTCLGIQSSQKGGRKTRLLNLLGALVHRPVTACQVAPSIFLEMVEPARPTLLVDREECLRRGNAELRQIIESGSTRSTAFVLRLAGPRATNCIVPGLPWSGPCGYSLDPLAAGFPAASGSIECPPIFSPGLTLASSWCPKVIATIDRLPENIASQCIQIVMPRKRSGARSARLSTVDPFANSLRHRCARFVLDHAAAIADGSAELSQNFEGPVLEVWEPLLVLADIAGDEWPLVARQAALALTQTRKP